MNTDGLDHLFAPRSVALVGASADPGKWGQWLLPGLVAGSSHRPLTLVNRRAEPIEGLPSVATLTDCSVAPDLVVVCVPPAQVEQSLRDAADVGARSAIVITSGIDAVLGEGAEAAMVAEAVSRGMRIVGPNCFGMFDADSDLRVTWSEILPGSMAVVSQSGSVGIECINASSRTGLGVSRFVSLGNQRDVSAADVLFGLVEHESTEVVALYLETFGEGRRVIEAVQALREAGKPTVVLTVGASEASRNAARSHTGSMTSGSDVVDAACRAAGTARVSSPWELVDVARVLAGRVRPRGRRAAVVGDSGGQGAIAADLLHAHQLMVPPLDAATQTQLAARLPYTAAVTNPIDLGGGGALDADNYVTIVEASARSGVVDTVLLTGYFGAFAGDGIDLDVEVAAARRMADVAEETGVAVVVHCQVEGAPALAELHAAGIASYPSIERATRALGVATAICTASTRALADPGDAVTAVQPGYWAARSVLQRHGIRFPRAALLAAGGGADAASTELAYPVVLKADWLAHKSEQGGVVVGLADAAAVDGAVTEMRARLGTGELVVEEMDVRAHCVEVLVGVRRDPVFGPVVMMAAGGTEAEVWNDTTVELAPVTAPDAMGMIRRLRCAQLLDGWRGRPRVDIEALAEVVALASSFVMAHADVEELELNPVRVGTDGAVAVDAMIVTG